MTRITPTTRPDIVASPERFLPFRGQTLRKTSAKPSHYGTVKITKDTK